MEGARRARTAGGSACTRGHAAGFATGGSARKKTTPRLRAAEAQMEKKAVGQSPRAHQELSARRGGCQASLWASCCLRRATGREGRLREAEGCGRPLASPSFPYNAGKAASPPGSSRPGPGHHALLRVLPALPQGLRASTSTGPSAPSATDRRVWDRRTPQSHCGCGCSWVPSGLATRSRDAPAHPRGCPVPRDLLRSPGTRRAFLRPRVPGTRCWQVPAVKAGLSLQLRPQECDSSPSSHPVESPSSRLLPQFLG